MSFSLRERLCSSGRSVSSELGQARRILLLRFFFIVTPLPGGLHPQGLLGKGEGAWGGWNGEEGEGRREVGRGGVQGEVDQPQAQCLPRISKNVPLERSHTRHGKNQCAPSHTYTRLIYIHEQATNGCVHTVGGCHRLLGSPRLIWSDGSGGGGAGDCARHHPFIGFSPSHHL